MKKVIIFGVGEFAEMMLYYLREQSNGAFDVAGFVVDDEFLGGRQVLGVPVCTVSELLDVFPAESFDMLIAVGYSRMRARKHVYEKVKALGYRLINYVHPSVDLKNIIMGENNIILSNVTVEPFVSLGDNNVVWSGTLLGHHLVVGSHNYISAKCLMGGKCVVGDMCFIGNGVVMINSLEIKSETYIVAGSNIRKSTQHYGMYSGNPASLLKFNEKSGIVIK